MNKKRSVITALVVTGLIATSTTSAFAHDGKGKWGRGQHGGGAVNSLVTAGTITQSQADTFSAEMKTKLDAKFATKLNTVLSDLVSKSSITQAKADSIKSASTSKRGLRQLVRAGTVTSGEANLIRDGLRALPKEDVPPALPLVPVVTMAAPPKPIVTATVAASLSVLIILS